MICPKCERGELIEDISIKEKIFRRVTKTYTYFCPLCNFESIKEIKISREDKDLFINSQLNKPKEVKYTSTSTKNINTTKK